MADLAFLRWQMTVMEQKYLLERLDQRSVVECVLHDVIPVMVYVFKPLPEGLQQPAH